MKKNSEIRWAVAIGAIMITICLIAIMVSKSGDNKASEINLKIYKLNTSAEKMENYYYEECKVSTDVLVRINKEYKKTYKLEDKDKITGGKILGNYKVVDGDKYIAFDKSEKNFFPLYRSDTSALYEFDSNLNELIVTACGE